MTKKRKEESGMCCCRVEALTTIDGRGQMVLPKNVRDRAKIAAGDKLAIVSLCGERDISCICLMKSQELAGMVKDLLGPMIEEVAGGRKK